MRSRFGFCVLCLVPCVAAASAGAPHDSPDTPAATADVRLILDPKAEEGAARLAMKRLPEYDPAAVRAVLSVLIEAVANPDWKVRDRAYQAVGELGDAAGPAVPVLLDAAQRHGDVRGERGRILLQLGRIRRRPDLVVPVLVNELASEDRDHRHLACFAIARFGPGAAGTVPALLELMKRRGGDDIPGAAMALRAIGPGAAAAVPELLRMLKDGPSTERGDAAAALGGIGAVRAEVVRALVEAARDVDPTVRRGALRALAEVGTPAARAALPVLRELERTPQIERELCVALVRLGDDLSGLPRLRELALAEPPSLDVVKTLPLAGPAGARVLGEVVEKGGAGTLWALQTLEEMGSEAAPALPQILALVRAGRTAGPKAARFDAAVRALGAAGAGAKEALPLLMELAEKHPNANVRRAARAAVRRVRGSEGAADEGKSNP